MPIYEYRCYDCRRKVSVFFRSVASVHEPRCPRCNGTNLERLFSRVFVRRSESRAVHEESDIGAAEFDGYDGEGEFGDEGLGDLGPFAGDEFGDDADPRAIAQWTRQMSAQMGEPLDPELDQALTDIERGADPEEVMDRLEESDPSQSPGWDEEF